MSIYFNSFKVIENSINPNDEGRGDQKVKSA